MTNPNTDPRAVHNHLASEAHYASQRGYDYNEDRIEGPPLTDDDLALIAWIEARMCCPVIVEEESCPTT